MSGVLLRDIRQADYTDQAAVLVGADDARLLMLGHQLLRALDGIARTTGDDVPGHDLARTLQQAVCRLFRSGTSTLSSSGSARPPASERYGSCLVTHSSSGSRNGDDRRSQKSTRRAAPAWRAGRPYEISLSAKRTT